MLLRAQIPISIFCEYENLDKAAGNIYASDISNILIFHSWDVLCTYNKNNIFHRTHVFFLTFIIIEDSILIVAKDWSSNNNAPCDQQNGK